MITKIQKWGNSLGLRIPKRVAEEVHVRQGSEVEISVERGRLVVLPPRRSRYRLKTLLSAITRDNLHAAVDTGGPMGRERL